MKTHSELIEEFCKRHNQDINKYFASIDVLILMDMAVLNYIEKKKEQLKKG